MFQTNIQIQMPCQNQAYSYMWIIYTLFLNYLSLLIYVLAFSSYYGCIHEDAYGTK